MKRYDIYWVRLDPVEGAEIGKTRPCVIVSDDCRNRSLATVVVCPLTTMLRPRWRTRLQVNVAGEPADICADQIRTISKTRLTARPDSLSPSDIVALRDLLIEMYGKP
jgi:mRNA interferase MazF